MNVDENSLIWALVANRDAENTKTFRRNGLSLSPESILFLDTFPGEEYKSKIMFHNISANKIIVRIGRPYSLSFQVNDDGSPVFLSPGLSLIRVVSFKCTLEKVTDSYLPVWINSTSLEIPIRVKHGQASLSVSPDRINFGTVDLGSRCMSRYLLLTNTGAGSSRFSVDLGQNKLDLVAAPRKGTLLPYSSVRVKLDLAAFIPGEHTMEFWIKGSPPAMVVVEVSVLMPFLQAVHPNTTARFTLIDFHPTYFDTVRYETLIVRNMSSGCSSFVVLAEINNELMTLDEIRKKDDENSVNYRCFSVEPREGVLGPFESRIFTIWFHPRIEDPDKGWIHEQPAEKEFLCFLRVFKVNVAEMKEEKERKITRSDRDVCGSPGSAPISACLLSSRSRLQTASQAGYKTATEDDDDYLNLRLCLHGCGQKPSLGLLTTNFVFSPIKEGEKIVRVIHIKNLKDLHVYCKFKKSPGFQVSPAEQLIKGKTAVELTLYFKATSLGMSTKHLVFDILSYQNFTNEKGKSLIGQLKIPVKIDVKASAHKPEPKFIMGITPKGAHEVGIHTETIKYSDQLDIPKGIPFPKTEKDKPWLQSSAHIAFPNDMTKSFRVKETDKSMKSIFTGKKRYFPPVDKEYTYTKLEAQAVKKHKDHYWEFIDRTYEEKVESYLLEDNRKHCWSKSPSEMRLYKHVGMESLLEKSKELQKMVMNYKLIDTFYPLTPSQLYNVRIMPKKLDFGQIPPYVDCSRTITVENMNEFAVSIYLHMQKDFSKVNDVKFIVGPKKRTQKQIMLNLKNLGRYYSNVSFVVNNNDCFDMTLVADVVNRTLWIVPDQIVINSKNNADDIFQVNWVPVKLINNLYVPTSFEWKVPADSSFRVVPSSGTVPGQRGICCAVYFDTAYEAYSANTLDLIVISGESSDLKITRIQDTNHNVAVLLQKKVLPPLSVHLEHVDTLLLFNNGFKDAVFHIIMHNPMEGISISPVVGKISGKSCIGLDVVLQINSVLAFDFTLFVKVQHKSSIEVKYLAFVFFPKVRFSPAQLDLQSIPCYSLTTYPLKAENYGHCTANVHFLLDEYPQIKLSDNKKYNLPGYRDGETFSLKPGTTKDFYLHFTPQDFATYELLLPAVFNQTIGPPKLYDDDSQLPMNYIKPALKVNRILKNIDLSLPPKLSSMKIDCSIGRGFISISPFAILFSVGVRLCSQRKRVLIQNLTDNVSHIFFDLKGLGNTPFSILKFPKDGLVELEPRNKMSLQFVFSPSYPDTYEAEIPVYVREFSQSVPYNYINFTGEVPKSTIYIADPFIHFLPVPVGVCVERAFEVIASHQPRETKLNYNMKRILGEQDEMLLEIIFPKGNRIPEYEIFSKPTTIPVIMKFRSKKVISQRGTIIFTDDYEGICELLFTACADNTVMSCYNYLTICHYVKERKQEGEGQTIKKSVSEADVFKVGEVGECDMDQELLQEVLDYPMFPSSTSETQYAKIMRSIVHTMERWLYEQGFSGSFRMIIGEQIAFSRAYSSCQSSRSKNPTHANIKSIIDLLYLFVGRDLFLEYNMPTNVPEDNIERIEYAIGIYRQALRFIKVQGGNTAHIFPVYLLSYDDYVDHLSDVKTGTVDQRRRGIHYQDIFEEKFSKKKILPREDFERYNKQAWLDFFLQFHRVIIQGGIPFMRIQKYLAIKRSSEGSDNFHEAPSDSESSVTMYRTIEKGDKILIDWLNLIYHQAKMKNPDLNLLPRVISDFGEDLEDAVVLAVVTIFFCPYLYEEYFSDFYFEPTDRDQGLHNAALLCIGWTTIRLGMTVTPEDFLFINPVFMTMLVTHLYSVLHTYIPQRSIEFLTSLNSSVSRKLSLINPNEKTIGYYIKIVGDCSNSFVIERSRPTVVISQKSVIPISITYSAKQLYPTKATLLLCGHCIPNGYVENIVLTLEGDPYNLTISRDYTISTPLMKPTFIIANVASPYDVEAEYDLWYAEEEPKPGNLNIRPWSEVKTAKLPRSLFLGCDRLIVPPDSSEVRPAPLSITAACFTRTELYFWIILRNDEVGDFIVRIILKPKLEAPSVILRVPLPTDACTGYKGTVLCSTRCPRLLSVSIPSRNIRLWTTVKTMLAMTLEPKEKAFWDTHYETRIGLDLMKWLLGKNAKFLAKEISFIFDSKVVYKVSSLSPLLQVQESVEIEDIHSQEFTKLMVHLCCWAQSEVSADILLESESGQEARLYRIQFYGEAPLGDKIRKCRKGCTRPASLIDSPISEAESKEKVLKPKSSSNILNKKYIK